MKDLRMMAIAISFAVIMWLVVVGVNYVMGLGA